MEHVATDVNSCTSDNISWAAYHANLQIEGQHATGKSALLPLFKEAAHTPAMIKHSLQMVVKSVNVLNPSQVPVIAFDQPLYAIAKKFNGYGQRNLERIYL